MNVSSTHLASYRRLREQREGVLMDEYERQLREVKKSRKGKFAVVKSVKNGRSRTNWLKCNQPGCTKAFPTQRMAEHILVGHQGISPMCAVCKETFSRKDALIRHRSHGKDANREGHCKVCKECGKGFEHPSDRCEHEQKCAVVDH